MSHNKLRLVLLATFLILNGIRADEVTDALEVQDTSQEIELQLDDEETFDIAPPEIVSGIDDEVITVQDIELFSVDVPDQSLDAPATDEEGVDDFEDGTNTRIERKMNDPNAKRGKVNKLRPAAKKGEAKQRISPTIASEGTNQVVDTFIEQLNEMHRKNAPRHLVAVANLQVPSLNRKNQKNQPNQLKRDRIFLNAALRTDLNNSYVKYSIGEAPSDYQIERKLSVNSSSVDFDTLERQQLGDRKNKNRFNAVVSGLDRMKRNGDITVINRQNVQVLRVPVLLGPVEMEFRPSVNYVLRESSISSRELPATLILKEKGARFTAVRLVKQPVRDRVAQQILIRNNLNSQQKEQRLISHLSLEMQRLWSSGILISRTNKQIRQYFAGLKASGDAKKN